MAALYNELKAEFKLLLRGGVNEELRHLNFVLILTVSETFSTVVLHSLKKYCV